MPMSTLVRAEGACVVCRATVVAMFTRNGGLPVDVHGYSGLTADGDHHVCPDHHCEVCGQAHDSADDFDNCHFSSEFACDPDAAHDSATGR